MTGRVQQAGLDVPILNADDTRWARLKFELAPGVDLRDRFRGALVGGAIGDAMGRPNEGVPADLARERRLREYRPWGGWRAGSRGTITDDTQMTMWLAQSILATAGRARGAGSTDLCDHILEPQDLADRFTREHIRGIGQASQDFVHAYRALGRPWYKAGTPSAGNDTAMRAAPVGLVHLGDPYRIYRDSLLQSVVRHRCSMATRLVSVTG